MHLHPLSLGSVTPTHLTHDILSEVRSPGWFLELATHYSSSRVKPQAAMSLPGCLRTKQGTGDNYVYCHHLGLWRCAEAAVPLRVSRVPRMLSYGLAGWIHALGCCAGLHLRKSMTCKA
jgi:hypothetical protein